MAEVAAAHVALLDAQIRTLRLRRAVLSTVARRGNTTEETLFMHKLARLSAQERQQIIDDFVDGVFAGIDPEAPGNGNGNGIARGMRRLPAELPDDPAPEQVDAWIELAELVADQGFRRRVRAMALAGAEAPPPKAPPPEAPPAKTPPAKTPDYRAVVDQAGQALTNGIPPASPEGQAVLARLVAPQAQAAALEQLDTFTDARVERYWQLLAIINGQPVPPSVVPAFEWLIDALRANLGHTG